MLIWSSIFNELGMRWAKARLAALTRVTQDDAQVPMEDELLARVNSDEQAAVLRAVFDNSQALGRSFCRYHGLVLERSDLLKLLPETGIPCAERQIVDGVDHASLRREPCGVKRALSCDFYREALDGLVLGLTDGEVYHRRHAAFGHGDTECLDVLFEPEHASDSLRFGSIPGHLSEELGALTQRLLVIPGISVRFRGLSEGVLSYEVLNAGVGIAADSAIKNAVKRRFPQLAVKSVSPLPVIATT